MLGSVPIHLPPMHIGQTMEMVQHMWAGHLKELIEAGKIKSVIDRCSPWNRLLRLTDMSKQGRIREMLS